MTIARCAAAALSLALLCLPSAAVAASCCGGGGGGGVVVPRGSRALLDLSVETERYDGFWDQAGLHQPDPAGASPAQHRVTAAAGWRFASDWQVGLAVPWVWNDNRYAGFTRRTSAVGDTTVSVTYDLHAERSIWKVLSPADLLPSVSAGVALLLPTGLSPYDAIGDRLDVTGRGFYRLDGTLAVDKTYRGLSASLALAYGVHLERPVNRHNGLYVTPYRERLGDRASASLSLGYRLFVGSSGDSLAGSGALSWLREGDGTAAGERQPGLARTALAATVTWAGTDRDWSLRASFSHALRLDGWGRGFPTTDVLSLGYRHVLP